jgi:hypothetical protein
MTTAMVGDNIEHHRATVIPSGAKDLGVEPRRFTPGSLASLGMTLVRIVHTDDSLLSEAATEAIA